MGQNKGQFFRKMIYANKINLENNEGMKMVEDPVPRNKNENRNDETSADLENDSQDTVKQVDTTQEDLEINNVGNRSEKFSSIVFKHGLKTKGRPKKDLETRSKTREKWLKLKTLLKT